MDDNIHVICEVLESYIGKNISILWDDSKVCGHVVSLKNNGYYYELLLKRNNVKKKFIIFYPFSFKYDKAKAIFDYRLSTISNQFSKELLYNLKEVSSPHSFLDKIVTVCELT